MAVHRFVLVITGNSSTGGLEGGTTLFPLGTGTVFTKTYQFEGQEVALGKGAQFLGSEINSRPRVGHP